MKEQFTQSMHGISPEQTRAAMMPSIQKTMVENEQPVPVLKPLFMGQEVDNQTHKQKLKEERQRLVQFREQVQTLQTQFRVVGRPNTHNLDKQAQHFSATRELLDDFNQLNNTQTSSVKRDLSY